VAAQGWPFLKMTASARRDACSNIIESSGQLTIV
jgi:hypothetical protein